MSWSFLRSSISPAKRRPLRTFLVSAVVGLVVVGAAAAMNRHAAVAPSNSSLPAISGTLAPGSTVSASPGTWSGSAPISYQYQWRICGADGNACHDIAGATGQTFQVRDQDPGNTLRVHVIASNADGSSADTSEPSGKISGSAPVPANTSPPTLGGNAAVGSTVTANTGTWSGSAPIGFQYQWQICGSNGSACHDIAGATAQSYQPKSGDQGNTLRVKVTASNSHGSSATTSDPTGTISAAPPAPAPAPNGCPRVTAGAQAVSVNDVSAPARLQVDQFQLVTGPITRSMSSFQARFHVSDTCGQAVQGAQVYVTGVPYNQISIPGEAMTDANGWVTMTFSRLSGFPASRNQQLMVLFVRARRAGDPVLSGISTRRLVSLHVRLNG